MPAEKYWPGQGQDQRLSRRQHDAHREDPQDQGVPKPRQPAWKAAQAPQLKRAFAKHKTETEGHVARLEKVFAAIDKKPQAKRCDAIVGITDEGAEIMKEYKGSPALDAGLLAAAQAVEHYEISRYGTLKTWANELGLRDATGLLDQTLAEEKKTDALLTEIAERAVNAEAEAA